MHSSAPQETTARRTNAVETSTSPAAAIITTADHDLHPRSVADAPDTAHHATSHGNIVLMQEEGQLSTISLTNSPNAATDHQIEPEPASLSKPQSPNRPESRPTQGRKMLSMHIPLKTETPANTLKVSTPLLFSPPDHSNPSDSAEMARNSTTLITSLRSPDSVLKWNQALKWLH